MATKIGDMAVYISANTYGLARDLTRASQHVSSFGSRAARQMANLAGSIRSSLGDVFKVAGGNLLAGGIQRAAGGMVGLVESSLKLAGAAEVSVGKFETILGSLQEAKALTEELRAYAAVSPVSVTDANEGATRLLAAGVSREQVVPTISRLSDLSMGDPESLKRLITAYGQVKTTGRLQGDEWNQIANIGTLNFKDLAATMGVAEDQVKKLIESGRVGFYDLQRAIKGATEGTGRFAGGGAKYAETYAGKIDKLGDSWDDLKRHIGGALIEEMSLKTGADDAGNFLDSLKPFVDLLRPAVRFVGELGRSLAQMAGEGGKAFLDIADVLGGKLARAFPQTIAWIKEMVGGLQKFKLDPQGIADFADRLGDGAVGFIQTIGGGIAEAIKWARPYWDDFVDGFVTPIKDAIGWVVGTLTDASKVWAQAKDLTDDGHRYRDIMAKEKKDQNISASMKQFGLNRDDATSLVAYQDLAARSLKDEDNARLYADHGRRMKAFAEQPNHPADAISAAQWEGSIADSTKRSAAARETRMGADWQVQAILKKGDSSKGVKIDPADLSSLKAAALKLSADAIADRRKPSADLKAANLEYKPDKPQLESRLSDLATSLKAKFVDPVTAFGKDIADLDAIKAAGRLSEDDYALAYADKVSQLAERAGASNPPQLAPALELGSAQLASMVASAGVGTGPQSVEGLLKQIADINQQQLTAARATVAQGGQKTPVINAPE